MEKLIILNHKMNLEYEEVYPYIDKLNSLETNHNIVVCPSSIYLSEFMNHCTWGIGAQNVSDKLDGNYTGEISTLQLKSLGVEYSMIGHYERKKYFHETNQIINQKLKACLETNIIPILCFGETGKEEDILTSLDKLLENIDNIQFIIFAYEPLKAVSVDDLKEIEEKIKIIYSHLYEKYKTPPTIVYGGGIHQRNVSKLLQIEHLSGILIGKLSANIQKVEKIVKSIE